MFTLWCIAVRLWNSFFFVKNKWKTNQTGNSFPTSVHWIFVSFLTWYQKKPLMLKLYVWRYCMPYDLQTSNFRQPFFFLTVCKNQEQKYRTVCKKSFTCAHVCAHVHDVCSHTSLQYLRNLPHILSCSETLMPPLECSFRTISILLTVPCGRFGSVGHALQGQTSTDRQRPRIFLLNQPDRCFH